MYIPSICAGSSGVANVVVDSPPGCGNTSTRAPFKPRAVFASRTLPTTRPPSPGTQPDRRERRRHLPVARAERIVEMEPRADVRLPRRDAGDVDRVPKGPGSLRESRRKTFVQPDPPSVETSTSATSKAPAKKDDENATPALEKPSCPPAACGARCRRTPRRAAGFRHGEGAGASGAVLKRSARILGQDGPRSS